MDLKKSTAPVSTTTIDKNLVDAKTENIYEAISIIAKRASQINLNLISEYVYNFAFFQNTVFQIL